MGEVICLSVALYFESRSESVAGNIAVSQVILNRVESPKYPATICEVVKQGGEIRNRCQFSFYCDSKSDNPSNLKDWQRSLHIAKYVLLYKDRIYDFSEGSLNYYNPSLASPAWARKAKSKTKIGNHTFVRF